MTKIQPRPRKFQLEDQVGKNWYNNDPVATQFYNALSTVFPIGEEFFIRSVQAFSKEDKSEELKKQIQGFMIQEANHMTVHKQYNSLLRKQGCPIERWDHNMKVVSDYALEKFSRHFNLASTVVAEHYTATIGVKILSGALMDDLENSPMKELWLWHAAEEVEHKSVAINLYHEMGGRYRTLCLAFFVTTLDFWRLAMGRMFSILRREGQLFKWKTFKSMLKFFLHPRKGIFTILILDILKILLPGFHPDKMEGSQLVAAYDKNSAFFSEKNVTTA